MNFNGDEQDVQIKHLVDTQEKVHDLNAGVDYKLLKENTESETETQSQIEE